MIKFFNIYRQDYKSLNKIFKDIRRTIKNSNFIKGKPVLDFENKFSKFCNSNHSISCNSGSDALFLSLKSLNLPKNSEVILPAMTYCATVFSVLRANLIPVLADVKKNRSTICPLEIKKKLSKNTKAIILVHLYGDCCDIHNIKKIIKDKKIIIIEDAAQAHGARDCSFCEKNLTQCCNKGNMVGSIGDFGCFSFYPGKNLGGYGDGGMITCKNKNYKNKIAMLANLGGIKKFEHKYIGYNSRLDTIQANILNVKLNHLLNNNQNRKKIADYYNQNINNKFITKLNYYPGCAYHQYVIVTKKINRLIFLLQKNKIEFGRHYPEPIHKIKAVSDIFKNEKYPNAERLAKYGISIPIDPNLTKKQIRYISEVLNKLR